VDEKKSEEIFDIGLILSQPCSTVVYMRTAEQLHDLMQSQTLLLQIHTIDFNGFGHATDLDWLVFLLEDIRNLMRNEGAVATPAQARRLRNARRAVRAAA
jgi:hypothetical protein